ncbi:MAG: glycoside hydrolase family 3 N-terminal domain-containing protein [Paludibacter sp.]|nr:glycoside hydrolase family 3 N-terminal domain-containing protein [Paludibacter sp.]
MKKKLCLIPLLSLFLFTVIAENKPNTIPTPETSAAKLVSQLSLAEKISQLKISSYENIRNYVNSRGEVNLDSLKKNFPTGVGGIGLDKDLDPVVYVNVANAIRHYNKTLLHPIPPMFIGEGLHGFMAKGATVFPQAIALGCSWDTDLLGKVFSVTALEASARGVKQLFSPVLDLAREPRFGRTEEMYSEDSYLAAICGQAAIWGFQGHSGLPDATQVAATLKHFVGHGQPEGGRNVAPINISPYDLLNNHIQPFEKCIHAGALSVMPSYNEMNGIPNHGSKWLLRDILRDKLGFNGLITSDQDAINEMYRTHGVVSSFAEAAKLAIENGVDLDLRFSIGAYDELENLVRTGKLNEKLIDESVTRFLILKYKLGLFESKDIVVSKMLEVTNSTAHKALALEVAQKSLVLLKNNSNTLPLDASKLKTVAVIGPLAKGVHFGGYTAEPRHGIDVLQGIQNFAGTKFKVVYAEGCCLAKEESSFWKDDVQTPIDENINIKLMDEAVDAAAKSDVVVLALGETVAFSREAWGENHLGDRDNLDLLGKQDQLVEMLLKTGKPVVVLMFGGRPLSFNYVAENVPAIIQVFYPGQEGGTAIADVLFGKVNPSGKLSVTIPKSVGQLPCYYSRKPSRMRSYINFKGSEPLFPFGYGLSYTSFKYSAPTIDKTEITKTESVNVSVQVTNTGKVAGEEVVQLYIHDLISAGVRPVKELKDFTRISLQPNETKIVTFSVTPDKLSYYNPDLQKVIEPGDFDVMVGPNSVDVKSISFKVNP